MTQTAEDISYDEFERIVTRVSGYQGALLEAALNGGAAPRVPDLPDWLDESDLSYASTDGSDDYRDLPQPVLAVFAEDKTYTQGKLNETKSSIQAKAEDRDISEEELQLQIKKNNEKTVKQVKEKLDESANKVLKAAKEAKEKDKNVSYRRISQGHTKQSGFLQNLWAQVVEFVDNLIKEIKKALQQVVKWLEDRWNDVKKFFNRLFGF